jgi:hypothetical protein
MFETTAKQLHEIALSPAEEEVRVEVIAPPTPGVRR